MVGLVKPTNWLAQFRLSVGTWWYSEIGVRMNKVRIDDVDGHLDSATVQRPLTAALNARNVSLNQYELSPGDSFASGYHMREE